MTPSYHNSPAYVRATEEADRRFDRLKSLSMRNALSYRGPSASSVLKELAWEDHMSFKRQHKMITSVCESMLLV